MWLPSFIRNFLRPRLERARGVFRLHRALQDYGFTNWQIAELQRRANALSKRSFLSYLEAYERVATEAIRRRLQPEKVVDNERKAE
jgi:hypothetical protein